MNWLLKVKDWQLCAIYCSPLIVQLFLGRLLAYDYLFIFVLTFLFFALFLMYSWCWAVALNIERPLNRILLFKVCYILPIALLVMATITILVYGAALPPTLVWISHVLSLLSINYCFAFSAIQLRRIGSRSAINVGNGASIFFLIILFPIGIWILQPDVNRLYAMLKEERSEK